MCCGTLGTTGAGAVPGSTGTGAATAGPVRVARPSTADEARIVTLARTVVMAGKANHSGAAKPGSTRIGSDLPDTQRENARSGRVTATAPGGSARKGRPVNLRAPVTLLDVAQRAGVSVATASRVLNGGDRVPRPELQERVKAAADELGYTPNAQAQALAKSSTNVVGILVHDIEDPYFAAIANGVMRAADERNLLVMMASTFRDADREIAYLSSLRAQRARAAVMIGSRRTDEESLARTASEVETFLNSGAGLALVSQSGMPAHTVEPDNRSGAADLARELVGLGWRKFAVLGGPESLATARDRREGFLQGLAEAGLQPVAIEAGEFTRDGGHAAAEQLLDRQADVDCVFAVNDVMAVGAMSALRARGVDVPGRLGVAGFDDIATLRDVWPGLTTVRLPLEQMGRRALELAIQGGDVTTETFKAEVVLRESTARG